MWQSEKSRPSKWNTKIWSSSIATRRFPRSPKTNTIWFYDRISTRFAIISGSTSKCRTCVTIKPTVSISSTSKKSTVNSMPACNQCCSVFGMPSTVDPTGVERERRSPITRTPTGRRRRSTIHSPFIFDLPTIMTSVTLPIIIRTLTLHWW